MNSLTAAQFFALFMHFAALSLIAVGGAITTAPDMHRYLVNEHGWISNEQFTASVALAQAAPGPNILFVAVIGYNVAGLAGALAAMAGIMLPSSTLTLYATRWARARRETIGVRAFNAGLAPLTLGLLLSTGWILSEPARDSIGAVVLVAVTVLVMVKTRVSPMWLIALGAVAGMLGLT